MRKLIAMVLLACTVTAMAQGDIRQIVENGINTSNRQTQNHEWSEAFATCRSLDAAIYNYEKSSGKSAPELYYEVAKQRYRMYFRINKHAQVGEQLSRMYTLSEATGSDNIKEDFLMTRAAYLQAIGKHEASNACYRTLVEKSISGKDIKGVEEAYKKLLDKAKASKAAGFSRTVERMYANWQDSISAIKAAAELKELQADYNNAQEEISSKDTKIGVQRAILVVLGIIIAALIGGLVFLGGFLAKSLMKIKSLKKSLQVANDNNDQKSAFINNLGGFITPSLAAIEAGNTRQHIAALKMFFEHIKEFMGLEGTREQLYDMEETNISTMCTKMVEKFKAENNLSIPLKVDVSPIVFNTNADALCKALNILLTNIIGHKETEKITLEFKKGGAKSGKFVVTGTGMALPEDERETLFTPFAKVRDLSTGDGLDLPTCSMIATKLNGVLHLDNEFRRGVRFVLEMKA